MDVEDEKKPFDAELDGKDGGDTQPDPDEHLMLDQGNGRVWLVRIPKNLMERWAAIDSENIHLASLRVYSEDIGKNGKPPRIVLFLPPNKDPSLPEDTPLPPQDPNRPRFNYFTENKASEPDCYELEMLNDVVENQVVVAERPKDPTLPPAALAAAQTTAARSRTTILTGRVKHECSLKPMFTENYRKQIRERNLKYHTPARTTMRIEDAGIAGGRGGINRISSAVGMGASEAFSDLVKTKAKPTKGNFERMARMPRNQLLDLLFQLFRDQPHWGLKPLRERTQQPEAYLKEVLNGIAFLHRSGEFNGMWELTEFYKGEGVKNEAGPSMKLEDGDAAMDSPSQAMDFDDDDEDEDEDMEEVS